MTLPAATSEPVTGQPPPAAQASSATKAERRPPSRWQTIRLFIRADLAAMAGSWLCRGFFLASVVITVLELKGMQAGQKPASQMREADCVNDAILSRAVTRGEYIIGKLLARCLAIVLLIAGTLLPTSIWAIRQDKLVRTEEGYVTSAARNTKVEAWEPKKVFNEVGGTVKEMTLKVGDSVRAGDTLAVLDDRVVFDELETERRAEEKARTEVINARRKVEDARRNVAQAEDALEKAERSLVAKDLLSKLEQADRQTDVRSRKRDLVNAGSALAP